MYKHGVRALQVDNTHLELRWYDKHEQKYHNIYNIWPPQVFTTYFKYQQLPIFYLRVCFLEHVHGWTKLFKLISLTNVTKRCFSGKGCFDVLILFSYFCFDFYFSSFIHKTRKPAPECVHLSGQTLRLDSSLILFYWCNAKSIIYICIIFCGINFNLEVDSGENDNRNMSSHLHFSKHYWSLHAKDSFTFFFK